MKMSNIIKKIKNKKAQSISITLNTIKTTRIITDTICLIIGGIHILNSFYGEIGILKDWLILVFQDVALQPFVT